MTKHSPRDQRAISQDLEDATLGFHNVGLVIDLAADYALEKSMARPTNDPAETIYAVLAAAAALQRETLLNIGKIGDELRTGKYHAGQG